MAKKRPARSAKKATAVKKKRAISAKGSRRPKAAVTGVSLGHAARRADLLARSAVEAHVQSAYELEQARQQRRAAARALGRFNAAEAARAGRSFYNFFAQGDSWFDYPCGYDIIAYLQDELFGTKTAYFDNIAAYGRKVREMLSNEFKRALEAGPPNAPYWHAVLLSGGGNDLCEKGRFRDWLNPYDGGNCPAESYIASALGQELEVIRGLYEQAVELVMRAPRSPRLFVHGYDFAIPDDRCVTGPNKAANAKSAEFRYCFAGPWLWPEFEARGFHKAGNDNGRTLSCAIVVAILERFATMLAELERKYPNQLTLVPTQGTLLPIQATENWANELHPQNDPFRELAQRFYDKLPH
jgi:hypothetical protein